VNITNPEMHQLFTRIKEISLLDNRLPPSAVQLVALERLSITSQIRPCDEDLTEVLSSLRSLKELELSGPAFGDDFVDHLQPQNGLGRIELHWTSISDAKIAQFQHKYPDIEIVVSTFESNGWVEHIHPKKSCTLVTAAR
jgi:hypothetical protein